MKNPSETPGTSRSSRVGAQSPWIGLIVVALVAAGVIWVIASNRTAESDSSGGRAAAENVEPGVGKFLSTIRIDAAPSGDGPPGMVWIPGGEFSMGSDDPRDCPCGGQDAMPDARPIHRVYVDGFWMDRTEVTNDQFAEFVAATGYVTLAEKPPDLDEIMRQVPPGTPPPAPEDLVPGSMIFTPTAGPVSLDNFLQWWRIEKGADWRHPFGPDSDIRGKENYPVVHIAYPDAVAFCQWAGKRLPTEAEWEFAARGGLSGNLYPWGDDLKPDDRWMANIFQGKFPVDGGDTGEDGFVGIAPVGNFPPNDYGLCDIAGNVWEWCSDWYRADYYELLADAYPVARNPRGPDTPLDPLEPLVPKRVHRGGSFLCTDQYCTRYMVGTRGKGAVSDATNHTGFRCVKSPAK